MKELLEIQNKLKAPKNLFNKFGKYSYRSAESILEALKPLLYELKCLLTISDDMVMVGDRIYVKATVTLKNSSGDTVTTTAFAREDEVKKGMDESQITGASSSYARKYALNGMFCIDDTKDSDATNDGSGDELGMALQEIKGARSIETLTQIYNTYTSLAENAKFMSELSAKKKTLMSKSK